MSIDTVYDPKAFRSFGENLVRLLSDKIEELHSPPWTGLPWQEQSVLKAKAREILKQGESNPGANWPDQFAALTQLYLNTNNGLHSPHYMGHQVGPALLPAALFELIGAVSNNASGIYEMGPLPSAVERVLVEELGKYLGWDGLPFDGIVTHGGSLANMTALLSARNWRYPTSWNGGTSSNPRKPAIITSVDSHYSVTRAAGILGIGADQVLKAPVDDRRKMDPRQLQKVFQDAEKMNLDVFCIVGSACSTSVGAFDPLEDLGRIAEERGIWFHVDAAHGGGLLLSQRYRHLLKGIEKAHSVTWDAHKMMFMPSLCTFLFYRQKEWSYKAFQQDAPYLFDRADSGHSSGDSASIPDDFDSALRTLECTKRPLAMPLWMIWSCLGPKLFETLVDQTIGMAHEFYELLKQAPDFEPVHQPECNILCFRYLPKWIKDESPETISAFQAKIRKNLIRLGHFYITGTRIEDQNVLRISLMNPLTQRTHLEGLMEAISRTGFELHSDRSVGVVPKPSDFVER